jgi:hypothetical protein
MPHSLTLPLVAAATILAGTATGIGLGHSTVAEINPKHFGGGDDTQFYGDLAPNRPADWGSVAAAELQQAGTAPPPATNTAATWPLAPAPVRDRAVDRALAEAWREARAPAPRPRYAETVVYEAPAPAPAQPDPGARVRRYASYPIYRDEPPPPPPPDDEDDGPYGGDAATQ